MRLVLSKKLERKKVVLDINVLISSLFGGKPAEAFRRALKMRLLISNPIKMEFLSMINELAKKLDESQRRIFKKLIKQVFSKAEPVHRVLGELSICRDPKDDIYLETCQKGRAHFLVSGDKDLLEMSPKILKKNQLDRLKILSPSEFCDL